MSVPMQYSIKVTNLSKSNDMTSSYIDYITVNVPEAYQTPIVVGSRLNIVSLQNIISYTYNTWSITGYYNNWGAKYRAYVEIQKVTSSGKATIYSSNVQEDGADKGQEQWTTAGDYDVLEDDGLYYDCNEIGVYNLCYRAVLYDNENYVYLYVTFPFTVAENTYPLKRWTITDVVNRLLDLAEPLKKGETSRFKFSSSQAAKFDKVLAPQFSFTKQTLRECLQEVGGVIHGEPRLSIGKDRNGEFYYKVSFDLYGGMKKWKHANHPYIKKTYTQQIDNYCTNIDSNAENLVNALGAAVDSNGDIRDGGTITEPYSGGFKTVRCDTLYERITEDNMLISTQLPIYSIEKLECAYNSDYSNYVDITAYVFESSQYNTELSSYDSEYPYSKAYGIMYTQGSKNITALNFKQDNPVSSVFEKYAIVNILRAVTANDSLSIDEYPLLAFRITYTPFYSARVGQTKPYYKDFPRGAGLIYNQQSNVIESRYYGENLKGAVARLGNTDISITYMLTALNQIPKAGMLYDDDYYISTVDCEYLPTCIKCTIGLSKDFNRLSQYIGISNEKRYSEVSQTQAVERNVLYREYMLVTQTAQSGDTDSCIRYALIKAMAQAFSQDDTTYKPLTNVVAWGETGRENALNTVQMPVIASAFGNSISFGWAYADNYSAGAKSQYYTGNGVSGYYQNDVTYCDYYGRLYYYHFDVEPYGTQAEDSEYEATALGLPEYDLSELPEESASSTYLSTEYTIDSTDEEYTHPFILRKDNREQISVNYQIDFVTDNNTIIIGSALAANCAAVRSVVEGNAAKLYVFPERLNKFIHSVDGNYSLSYTLSELEALGYGPFDITVTIPSNSNGRFQVSASAFTVSGKAWAIVTPQVSKTETVEDELGGVISAFEYTFGGDVLVAQNMDITAGDSFPTVYFVRKKEIFDKTIWKGDFEFSEYDDGNDDYDWQEDDSGSGDGSGSGGDDDEGDGSGSGDDDDDSGDTDGYSFILRGSPILPYYTPAYASISSGKTYTITIYHEDYDYKMPETIDSVTNADYTYTKIDDYTATLVISNVTDDVVATITMEERTEPKYTITYNLTGVQDGNGSTGNPDHIYEGDTRTALFLLEDGYIFPKASESAYISVENATMDWDISNSAWAALTISEPTDDVIVTITGIVGDYNITYDFVDGVFAYPGTGYPPTTMRDSDTVRVIIHVITYADYDIILPEKASMSICGETVMFVDINNCTYTYDYDTGILTFSEPTGDVTVMIRGRRSYDITYDLTGAEGEDLPDIAYYGDSVRLTFNAAEHYKLPDSITVTGVNDDYCEWELADDGFSATLTFTIIADTNIAIVGETNNVYYNLSNVAAVGTATNIAYTGEEVTVTFEPVNDNYKLPSSITVTGVDNYTWVRSTGILTFVPYGGDVNINITADLAVTERNVTYNLTNVTATSDLSATVDVDGSITVTFAVNSGYKISAGTTSNNQMTFDYPNANNFVYRIMGSTEEVSSYTSNAVAVYSTGTTTFVGDVSATNCTYSSTITEGGVVTLTISNPTDDVVVTVQASKKHTIIFNLTNCYMTGYGHGGTATYVEDGISLGELYVDMGYVELSIQPDDGYRLVTHNNELNGYMDPTYYNLSIGGSTIYLADGVYDVAVWTDSIGNGKLGYIELTTKKTAAGTTDDDWDTITIEVIAIAELTETVED